LYFLIGSNSTTFRSETEPFGHAADPNPELNPQLLAMSRLPSFTGSTGGPANPTTAASAPPPELPEKMAGMTDTRKLFAVLYQLARHQQMQKQMQQQQGETTKVKIQLQGDPHEITELGARPTPLFTETWSIVAAEAEILTQF
jgi:hypothetical protein